MGEHKCAYQGVHGMQKNSYVFTDNTHAMCILPFHKRHPSLPFLSPPSSSLHLPPSLPSSLLTLPPSLPFLLPPYPSSLLTLPPSLPSLLPYPPSLPPSPYFLTLPPSPHPHPHSPVAILKTRSSKPIQFWRHLVMPRPSGMTTHHVL